MSVTKDPESVRARDPMRFAPRQRRKEAEPRLAAAEDSWPPREQPDGRRTPPVTPPMPALESQLESAVYESLRRPLDSHAISKAGSLAGEIKRRSLFGLAGRPLAAIAIAAIIALFFAFMMPAPRPPNGAQLLQSFSTALSPQHSSEDVVKPALAEFHALLPSDDTAQAAEREPPGGDSDKVLRQFMQWRRQANPSEAAEQPLRSEQTPATNR